MPKNKDLGLEVVTVGKKCRSGNSSVTSFCGQKTTVTTFNLMAAAGYFLFLNFLRRPIEAHINPLKIKKTIINTDDSLRRY